MNGKGTVKGMGESDYNSFPQVCSYDKGFYFFIRLGDFFGKIAQRSLADTVCIFF